jgi:glycosyltransferase involved in cell wall biosynthesis
MLEAMVAGKAIVASATGGIPEAVTSGREGVLVPPGEVSPLADALRLILTEPERGIAMAEAALARARTEFTVNVMADAYEALYANALRKRQKKVAQGAGPASSASPRRRSISILRSS